MWSRADHWTHTCRSCCAHPDSRGQDAEAPCLWNKMSRRWRTAAGAAVPKAFRLRTQPDRSKSRLTVMAAKLDAACCSIVCSRLSASTFLPSNGHCGCRHRMYLPLLGNNTCQ
ncbi:TPA: hypothetical protein ACH3X3_004231 [Trebouxia sp. C0006]